MYWDHKNTGGGAKRSDGEWRINAQMLSDIEDVLASEPDKYIDTGRLETNLASLQERAPVEEARSAEALWKETKQNHPGLFGEVFSGPQKNAAGKRGRSGLFRIAWIAAVLVICLGITASALGYNPITAFRDWANGMLGFYNDGPSDNMVLTTVEPGEYHSFAEALEAYGVDTKNCPTWVPSDFNLVEVALREFEDIIRIVGRYESDERSFAVRATLYPIEQWASASQRNEDGNEYIVNGNTFYILSNLDKVKADWTDDNCFFEISGSLSSKELKKMLDSIQQGE